LSYSYQHFQQSTRPEASGEPGLYFSGTMKWYSWHQYLRG